MFDHFKDTLHPYRPKNIDINCNY